MINGNDDEREQKIFREGDRLVECASTLTSSRGSCSPASRGHQPSNTTDNKEHPFHSIRILQMHEGKSARRS